jgi:hypothetical protein
MIDKLSMEITGLARKMGKFYTVVLKQGIVAVGPQGTSPAPAPGAS